MSRMKTKKQRILQSNTSQWLFFFANSFFYERRFDPQEKDRPDRRTIFGSSTLENGTVEAVGISRSAKFLFIASEATSKRPEWSCSIGYNRANPNLLMKDEWYVHCNLPPLVHAELIFDRAVDKVREIKFATTVEMQLAEQEQNQFSPNALWILNPNPRGLYSSSGTITVFRWSSGPSNTISSQ